MEDKYEIKYRNSDSVVKTNLALFKLLKEPLQLQEECIEFTLKVEAGEKPMVEQTYYCRLDNMPKNIIEEIEEQEE